MFEIKIDDARYWKTIVNSIVSLIDEGTFRITKEGIFLRATDAGGISMIIFSIPNKAFSKFNVEKNVAIGLNLDNLAKILASARDGEFLVMKDAGNRLQIEFGSKSSKRQFKLPMIEVSNDPEKEPKVEFESFVELKGDSLKEILKDASLLSSYVGFKTEKSSFGIRAKGDAGELEEEHPESADGIKKLTVTKPSSATFNLDYLERIVGSCPMDSNIALSLKTDEALKIDYKIGEASLVYYLANYMEN
jgi:proliferating cell nuclear antigen PCNA